MGTYRVEWTEEYWFRTIIVAKDKQEAIDKWSSGNYDDYGKLDHYGVEIQDGVDVEMIEEE